MSAGEGMITVSWKYFGSHLHKWSPSIVITKICLSIIGQEKFYNVFFTLRTGKVKGSSNQKEIGKEIC